MNAAEGFFVGLVVFAAVGLAVIVVLGVRARRAQEAENRDLTVDALRQQLGARLLDGPLIWGVWQGLLSAGTMRLVVRDGEGAPLTEIVHPTLGPRQPFFEWAGRRYDCVWAGGKGRRTLLRDAQSGEVMFSCRRHALRLSLFRAESDELLFELTGLSVFHPHARLVREGRELGRLLRPHEGVGAPLALTLRPQAPPTLALCFLLFSLR